VEYRDRLTPVFRDHPVDMRENAIAKALFIADMR
jgi:hypothetical protein